MPPSPVWPTPETMPSQADGHNGQASARDRDKVASAPDPAPAGADRDRDQISAGLNPAASPEPDHPTDLADESHPEEVDRLRTPTTRLTEEVANNPQLQEAIRALTNHVHHITPGPARFHPDTESSRRIPTHQAQTGRPHPEWTENTANDDDPGVFCVDCVDCGASYDYLTEHVCARRPS